MNLIEVTQEFSKIKTEIGSFNKKFYHLNSIENFIHNFGLIKSDSSRNFILNSLEDYFIYCNGNSITEIHKSLEIFNKYLKPVGKIYEKEAGFAIFIKPWLLTLYIVAINFIVYILGSNISASIICNLIILFFIFYLAYKYKEHKLYAFLW